MDARPIHVLVLCTGNSARSILGEAILERRGEGRIRGFSAGSHPKGVPHPAALALLRARGHATDGLRSKSWDAFAGADAPAIDIVITVCDSAAAEACPVWPGHPVTAHWGLPDPAAVPGPSAAQDRAFAATYDILDRMIARLVALPLAALDAPGRRRALASIAAEEIPAAAGT